MPPRLVSLFASLLLALTLVALTLTTTTHAVCGGLSPWEIVAGSCSKFVHCVDGTGPGARSPVARCSQLLLLGRATNDCGTGPRAAAAAAAPLSVKKNKKRVRRLCEEHVRYESVANALEVVAVYSGRKTRRSLGGTGSTAAGSSTTHTTETPASAVEMVARMLGAFQSELSADCASTLLIAQLRWSAQSASRLLDSIVAYDQAVMEHGVRGSRQLSSQQLSLPSTTSLGSSQQEQDTRDGVLIGNDTDDNNGVVDMADVEHRDTADSAITGSPVQLPTSTIFQSMARCHTARSRMAVDTLTAVVKLIVEGSIGNVRNTAGVDDTDDALLRPHEVSCLLKLERAPAADAFIEVYRASVAASTTSSDATSTSSSSFSSPSSSHHLSSPTLHRLLRIRRRTTVDCLRTLVDYGLSPASDPRYIILCADTVQGAAQLQGMRDYLHLVSRSADTVPRYAELKQAALIREQYLQGAAMTKLMTSVMWMQTRPAGLAEVMLVVRGVQSQRSVDCLNEFIRMRVALTDPRLAHLCVEEPEEMMHRFRFFTTLQSLPHASTVTALSTAYTPITGACLDLLPPSLSWPLAVCLRVINRRDLEAVEVVRANAERFGWSLDERRGSANAAAHVVRVAVALSKRREDWMCLKEAAEREPLTADVLRGCRGVRGDLRGAGGLRGDA